MGLPTSRDETCVADGIIKSSLLNNLQDGVIQLHAATRLARTTMVHAALMRSGSTDWAFQAGGFWRHSAGTNATLFVPVPCVAGDRVTGVKVYLSQVNASAIDSATLQKIASGGTGAVTALSNAQPSPVATGVQNLIPTVTQPYYTIAAGDLIQVAIISKAAAGNKDIYAVEFTLDRPV